MASVTQAESITDKIADWIITHVWPISALYRAAQEIIDTTDQLQAEKARLAQENIIRTATLVDLGIYTPPSSN